MLHIMVFGFLAFMGAVIGVALLIGAIWVISNTLFGIFYRWF